MSQHSENNRFTCRVCGRIVTAQGAGARHRNHCPACLHSGGVMEPVGVWVRSGGEWALIHRCRACGVLHSNRIAADDDPVGLMSLAVRPLARPPFPLAHMERMLREDQRL